MNEYRCERCGETFIEREDAVLRRWVGDRQLPVHWERADGTDCGGYGEPVREVTQ